MSVRSDAFQPAPLSDDDLREAAPHSGVRNMWVPITRREVLPTLTDAHEGDITEFWVETDTQYLYYRYRAPDGTHPAWYRFGPIPKTSADGAVIGETLSEKYRVLREVTQ